MQIFSIALLFLIMASATTSNAYEKLSDNLPKDDEVGLYFSGVALPINKILLIRKKNKYCAMKFTRAWFEMDEERLKIYADRIKEGGIGAESAIDASRKNYATYESYFNKDGTASFFAGSVERRFGTASLLPMQGRSFHFSYQPGNGCVECGSFKLLWDYNTFVSFIPLGKGSSERDYGIELAPTPWSDIKDINVKDNRIKWYRYDKNRKREFIPIDRIW